MEFSSPAAWEFSAVLTKSSREDLSAEMSYKSNKTVHIIDPNADTVIILKNPVERFADWDAAAQPQAEGIGDLADHTGLEGRRKKATKGKKSTKSRPRGRFSVEPGSEDAALEPITGWHEEEVVHQGRERKLTNLVSARASPSLFGEGSSSLSPARVQDDIPSRPASLHGADDVEVPDASSSSGSNREITTVIPADEDGIHYHVSSRHLMLASRVFRTMMTDELWAEGVREEDGRFYTRTEGWDPDALLAVLNVLHLKNRNVPRRLGLANLAKVAVIVDFYECEEAMEVFAKSWIDDLRSYVSITTNYCRELMLWMCIAYVFELEDVFKITTLVALKEATDESIRTMELPIGPRVIEDIERSRQRAIKSTMSCLHGLLDKYRSANYVCLYGKYYSEQCASTMLGALTRAMDAAGYLYPRLEAPFEGLSLSMVFEKLRVMKWPSWQKDNGFGGYHECNLSQVLSDIIAEREHGLHGLKLTDYPKRKG